MSWLLDQSRILCPRSKTQKLMLTCCSLVLFPFVEVNLPCCLWASRILLKDMVQHHKFLGWFAAQDCDVWQSPRRSSCVSWILEVCKSALEISRFRWFSPLSTRMGQSYQKPEYFWIPLELRTPRRNTKTCWSQEPRCLLFGEFAFGVPLDQRPSKTIKSKVMVLTSSGLGCYQQPDSV